MPSIRYTTTMAASTRNSWLPRDDWKVAAAPSNCACTVIGRPRSCSICPSRVTAAPRVCPGARLNETSA